MGSRRGAPPPTPPEALAFRGLSCATRPGRVKPDRLRRRRPPSGAPGLDPPLLPGGWGPVRAAWGRPEANASLSCRICLLTQAPSRGARLGLRVEAATSARVQREGGLQAPGSGAHVLPGVQIERDVGASALGGISTSRTPPSSCASSWSSRNASASCRRGRATPGGRRPARGGLSARGSTSASRRRRATPSRRAGCFR